MMSIKDYGVENLNSMTAERAVILGKIILDNKLLQELARASGSVTYTNKCPRTLVTLPEGRYVFQFLCCPDLGWKISDWLMVYLDEYQPIVHFMWSEDKILHDCAFPVSSVNDYHIIISQGTALDMFVHRKIREGTYIRSEEEKEKTAE